MADLGLGNLTTLKTHLLPSKMVPGTEHDAALTNLGNGVAVLIDQMCNRTFARLAGATEVFTANRDHWILRRYPLESVSQVDLRTTVTDGWVTQTDAILNQDEEAGIIYLGAARGSHLSQVRITYTGGYWYDTTEDSSGSLPGGATLLPADIKFAWLLQCQSIWEKTDVAGKQLGAKPGQWSNISTVTIAPQVMTMLQKKIRFNLT